MKIDGKEYKGVYALEDGWWFNQLCFSKKIYTKEQAIEIIDNQIKEIKGREVV